jgi:putative nucleotidyltransferase with HDIG domain
LSGIEEKNMKYVEATFPELKRISDESIREKVVETWIRGLNYGGWKRIEDIPYASNLKGYSLVDHVRAVTQCAIAMSDIMNRIYNSGINVDYVIAGAVLHDVGKTLEYAIDENILPARRAGRRIPHSLSGLGLAMEVGLPYGVLAILPHIYGELDEKTVEASMVKWAGEACADPIYLKETGMTLDQYYWVRKYTLKSDEDMIESSS